MRQVEDAVRRLADGSDPSDRPTKKDTPTSTAIEALKQRMTSYLGTRVQIRSGKDEKGEIRIPFLSNDDLNRILDLLKL